jgi:DNA-binding transcriptional regulator YiaG
VSSEINELLTRVKTAMGKEWGGKAKLAKAIGVDPSRVSEWLSGKKEPGGEYALKLLKWVEKREPQ